LPPAAQRGKIELVTSSFPERESFWANDFKKKSGRGPGRTTSKAFSNYSASAAVNFNGFNAAISAIFRWRRHEQFGQL